MMLIYWFNLQMILNIFAKILFSISIFQPSTFLSPLFLSLYLYLSLPLLYLESHIQQEESESNSYLKTNHLRRMITSNIYSNKRTFLNTPPWFNGERFDLWKTIFKILIEILNLKLWEIIINGLFIPLLTISMVK